MAQTTRTEVARNAAFIVVKVTPYIGVDAERSAFDIKHNSKLVMAYQSRNHGLLHREYSVGSVVAYALENNKDPIEAYNDCVARGHKTHWINASGAMITAHHRDPVEVTLVAVGDLVRFEGQIFEITEEPNSNLGLKFVSKA